MAGNGYTVKRLDEMEAAFGGSFVRARASLGVTAFGMQVLEMPPMSGDGFPEHDHGYDGQEEVYHLLGGSAELALPDRVVRLDPETFVRVSPATRRRLRSGPDGARVLIVGGVPGGAFQAHPITELGGPEYLPDPTASSAMVPDGPPPQLTTRGEF